MEDLLDPLPSALSRLLPGVALRCPRPQCSRHGKLTRSGISMSMNAVMLEVLQNANAFEILTRIIDEQSLGPHSTEMSNHIFQTCYNLCRLNKGRQEEVAQAGIIPVIESSSPLRRQFALSILRDLASAGKNCRVLLRHFSRFPTFALESILAWLQEETARVEDELARPKSLNVLLKCFVLAKAGSFGNLLDPLLKIYRHSTAIAIGITKAHSSGASRRSSATAKAVVNLNLLRIFRAVCDVRPNRALLVERYGIHETVAALRRKDGTPSLRGADTSKSSSAPKRRTTRRTEDTSGIGTPSPPLGTGPMNNPCITSAGAGLGAGTTQSHVGDISWQPGVGKGRR
ncbi:hypothetical protein EDB89DRAFT_2243319 [Lactarius sanguifluus]|nr:hypothetical protein EDB89DRAFT_2243319 [Lactarius sanguifluus]